jgi:hypothetical protein
MTTFTINEDVPVLVEFTPRPGVKQVSLSPDDLAEKSRKALDSAMDTIHHMARRVVGTINSLVVTPSALEVSFGLKLDAETGAIIAKAGAEASINVTLKWERDIFEGEDEWDNE